MIKQLAEALSVFQVRRFNLAEGGEHFVNFSVVKRVLDLNRRGSQLLVTVFVDVVQGTADVLDSLLGKVGPLGAEYFEHLADHSH